MANGKRLIILSGSFLLNLIIAVIGTAIVETPLLHIFYAGTGHAALIREYVLSSTVAALLGFLIYKKWRPQSARWIWIAGLLWFAAKAFARAPGALAAHQPGFGTGAACNQEISALGCVTWLIFIVPAIRTCAYSAAAWLASSFGASRPSFEDALVARYENRAASKHS